MSSAAAAAVAGTSAGGFASSLITLMFSHQFCACVALCARYELCSSLASLCGMLSSQESERTKKKTIYCFISLIFIVFTKFSEWIYNCNYAVLGMVVQNWRRSLDSVIHFDSYRDQLVASDIYSNYWATPTQHETLLHYCERANMYWIPTIPNITTNQSVGISRKPRDFPVSHGNRLIVADFQPKQNQLQNSLSRIL